MSPFENEVQPAFDPRLIDAPPQEIADTRVGPPPPSAPPAMPPVSAAMPTQQGGGGPRKPFLMPPPGTQAKIEAELPPTPVIQPPAPQQPPQARGAMPPPPITPDVELPAMEAKSQVPVGVPTGADAREVMGDRPPSPADLQLKSTKDALTEKLAARPAAPKENWGQRIATAILAMTKFAPATDLIVHPKWSAQERQYGRDLEVADKQFKVAQEALESETLAARREADAALKDAQTANVGVAEATKRQLNDPHRGEREIDPAYAAKNLPGLKPDAEGRYWVADSTVNELARPHTDPTANYLELPPDVAKHFGISPGVKMPPAQWEVLIKAANPERRLHFENSTDEITGDVTVTAFDDSTGARVAQSVEKGIGRKRPPAPAAGAGTVDGTGLRDKDRTVLNTLIQQANNSPLIKGADRTIVTQQAIDDVRKNPSSAAAQLPVLYGLIQVLDTYQSAVREGELQLAQETMSKIQQVQTAVTRVNQGQIVDAAAATALADAAQAAIDAIKKGAQQKEAQFESQARANGTAVHNAWKEYRQGFKASYDAPAGDVEEWTRDANGKLVRKPKAKP